MSKFVNIFEINFFLQLQRSYSQYYGSTKPENINSNATIIKTGNYYIHHAIFSFHNQKTAIQLGSGSKVLIEKCTFYNNSSTKKGGSFYIQYSDSVLVHVCCFLSSSSEYGCAYNIELLSRSSSKSYALECSVSECTGKGNSIDQWNGYIQVINMNTSYNIAMNMLHIYYQLQQEQELLISQQHQIHHL